MTFWVTSIGGNSLLSPDQLVEAGAPAGGEDQAPLLISSRARSTIRFDAGSARLSPAAHARIWSAAGLIDAQGLTSVRVLGYAGDLAARGDRQAATETARTRARVVASALRAELARLSSPVRVQVGVGTSGHEPSRRAEITAG